MGIDAVALLKVSSRELLRERLDAGGLFCATLVPLEDDAALLATHLRYGTSSRDQVAFRIFFTQLLGEDLARIHQDARGLLLFPDVAQPRGRSYEAVVAEVGSAGMWIPTAPLSPEQIAAFQAELMAEVNRAIADPSRVQQELTARLKALREVSSADLEVHLSRSLGGEGGLFACVLLQRKTPLPEPLPDSNQVHPLPDGAQLVVTTRVASDTEMIALQLGGEHAAWLEGHSDARGVLVFGDRALGDALSAANYEAAVTKIGSRGKWVKPKSLDELMREREALSNAFLRRK